MALIKCGISFPLLATIFASISFLGNAAGTVVRSIVSETCEADHAPFHLKMTPGFLASSLPYVGHHDCTDGGVCRNTPSACPLTSCCLPQSGTSNGTESVMHCGFLNPKGECVQLRSFRLAWQTCDGDSGGHSTSNFEIVHVTAAGIQCAESSSAVQFDIGDGEGIHLTLRTSECIKTSTRQGKMLYTLGAMLVAYLGIQIIGVRKRQFSSLCRNVIENLEDKQIAELLDDFQLHFIKTGVINPPDDTTVTKAHLNSEVGECRNSSEAVFSMCPSFLSGLPHANASKGLDGCKASGQCSGRPNISSNTCAKGKQCCVLTSGIGGLDAGCECVNGIRNCLEYKEFEVSLESCTDNGNVISTGYTIVALNFGQPCEDRTSLVDMYLDENGKIRITMKLQKCIPSTSGATILRVGHVVSAEQSIENFLPTVKAFLKNFQGADLIRFLGDNLAKKIASLD